MLELLDSFVDADGDTIAFYRDHDKNEVVVRLTVNIDDPRWATIAGLNPYSTSLTESELTAKLIEEGVGAVIKAINVYKDDKFYTTKKEKMKMVKPSLLKSL